MIKKSIPWANIVLAVGLGFAWTKLGLGAAIKDVAPPPPRWEGKRPMPTCPAGESAYLLPGAQDYTCMTYERFQALQKALRGY